MAAKKYPKADLNRYRTVFFNIGLILSLAITYTAFEWKFYNNSGILDTSVIVNDEFEEVLEIPPTEQPPPPPPEIKNVNIVIIEDTEELEDELEILFDIEMTEELVIEQMPLIIGEDEMEEEFSEEIFLIVEEQPRPIGGMKAFYAHINKKIRYPRQARIMGIQGKVFVQFVVEKDGYISQVKIVRGIGESCDNEALRVVSSAPAWNPGKQRGKPVRVKMVLPISFKLN